MSKNRKILFLAAIFITLIFISGCLPGTALINPSYNPHENTKSQLASVPSLKVKVTNFIDKREGNVEPILIGRRQAAFGTPMGDVQSQRPVFEIVNDTLKTEFARNGHVIVEHNEDFELTGVIQTFWVGTDVTALYWDVYGDVSLLITVVNKHTGSTTQIGPYAAKNVERTYTYPSVAIMERVIGTSLTQIMQEMSSDPNLRKGLTLN